MKKLWSVLVGILLDHARPSDNIAHGAPSKYEAAVDALVAKFDVRPDTPGVAVLVRNANGILFAKGYGLANLKSRAPITPTTLFELASVSKPLTALAVLTLHDRKQLSIDDDLRKYLPELGAYGEKSPIRIVDLLQHTSGLPDYMEFEDVGSRNKGYHVNDDYIDVLAKGPSHNRADFSPQKKYDYNNTNYLLLATLVERVTKKAFSNFMHDEIFAPVGMTHTFVNDRPLPGQRVPRTVNALGYERKNQKQPWRESWGVPPDRTETVLAVGDGSVWSTLLDMARFDEALRSGKFLSPALRARALIPSTTRDGERNDYGLGWQLYFAEPSKLIGYGHDGSWGGFSTTYYRYLVNDDSTIVLSNRGDFDVNAFWDQLRAIIDPKT